MANPEPIRVKDIATTATTEAADDFYLMDGATNGTRKIAKDNAGKAAIAALGFGIPTAHTASEAALPGAHSNSGASGAVVLTPTITIGARYSFTVLAAHTLTIQAPASVTIRVGASVTAAAGSVSSDVVGARIDLLALSATELIATSAVEVW